MHDAGPAARATVPAFLEPDDRLVGFAYDPFTDHFFLRLAPGNRIRVVDRPARAIKREFEIAGIPAEGGGDLAIRPRDGHVFLLHPARPALFETTRLGRLRRTITLSGLPGTPSGVAYDTRADQLLVLQGGGRTVSRHALDGARIGAVTLEREVARTLAYDSERREIYAPRAGNPQILEVFDGDGRWLRSLEGAGAFADVGPRSLIRVF